MSQNVAGHRAGCEAVSSSSHGYRKYAIHSQVVTRASHVLATMPKIMAAVESVAHDQQTHVGSVNGFSMLKCRVAKVNVSQDFGQFGGKFDSTKPVEVMYERL